MQSINTTHKPEPAKMPIQAKEYAASTFSESTGWSYDKASDKQSKPKRSFRQKIKSAFKDIGTSPFEYDDDEAIQTAGWLTSLPPSKT